MRNITIIVDVQFDFLIGGPLYVWGSEDIDHPIYEIAQKSDYVIATRDWHPPEHSSFKENGGEWPTHCVMGSPGAALYTGVDELADAIFSKGTDPDLPGYSAAENPGFLPFLRSIAHRDLTHFTVCGVATDYCVKAVAIDLASTFKFVTVPARATAFVTRDLFEQASVIRELEEKGVIYERF